MTASVSPPSRTRSTASAWPGRSSSKPNTSRAARSIRSRAFTLNRLAVRDHPADPTRRQAADPDVLRPAQRPLPALPVPRADQCPERGGRDRVRDRRACRGPRRALADGAAVDRVRALEAAAMIPGVAVGHWTDARARTGCTAVLLPDGTVASGEVRGGAPATREWEL